jgi:hypothetical protein
MNEIGRKLLAMVIPRYGKLYIRSERQTSMKAANVLINGKKK